MLNVKSDTLQAIFFLIFSASYLGFSLYKMYNFVSFSNSNPYLFTSFVSFLMLFCSLGLLATPKHDEKLSVLKDIRKILNIIFALFIFTVVLELTGFFVAGLIICSYIAFIFGASILKSCLIGLGISTFIVIIFEFVLKISLDSFYIFGF